MFNKLKEAVEASMDTIAPPPPLHDDFVYHWTRFKKHYLSLPQDGTSSVEIANLPRCLDRLREILVKEDEEVSNSVFTSEIGPCMEYVLKNDVLDLLISLAISDEPPGMKSYILRFISNTLIQLKKPSIAHRAIYIPLMKLMNICDGLLHSASEVDEIEFLLRLCLVLRKQSALAILFFSTESAKTLEETTNTGDPIRYGSILDLVLTYVDSADSGIRVKACQCIQLLCSMDDDTIAECVVNNLRFNHFIIGRLTTLFFEVSPTDYEKFTNIEASWTLDVPQESQLQTIRNRSAITFFNWVDFINQLCMECHETIRNKLSQYVNTYFLEESFGPTSLSTEKTIAILCKYHRMITSPILRNGFQTWLTATGTTTNPVLQTLLNHCHSENNFLVTTSLNFFMEVLNRCEEQIIYYLVLRYVEDRGYYDTTAMALSWSDEEDERRKSSSSPEASSSSKTLAPSNVDRIVQSFVNIVPIQICSYSSEDTIQHLQNQYEEIIARCTQFQWPVEAISHVENLSYKSNPESDCQDTHFSEGPFLKMLFAKLNTFPQLTLEQMYSVTTMISQLALLPHPYLHEYLLNSLLPLKQNVMSLHACLSHVMKDVSSKVEMIKNCEHELCITKERLMPEETVSLRRGEIERNLEAYVLLEKLCSDLATIAYVKYARCRSHQDETFSNNLFVD